MPIDIKKRQKEIARKLRKEGKSYSQIQKVIALPKSTIASWVKRLQLTEEQKNILFDRQRVAAQKNSERKSLDARKTADRIFDESSSSIKKISKRELWLMGVMLYWKQNNKASKIVKFSSSNIEQINFFVKWLSTIGGLDNDEILYDIFSPKNCALSDNDLRNYWAGSMGFRETERLKRIYRYGTEKKENSEKTQNLSRGDHYPGFIRVRVRASSALARQMAGWIDGIKKMSIKVC